MNEWIDGWNARSIHFIGPDGPLLPSLRWSIWSRRRACSVDGIHQLLVHEDDPRINGDLSIAYNTDSGYTEYHIIVTETGLAILLLCHQMMKVPDDDMNDEYEVHALYQEPAVCMDALYSTNQTWIYNKWKILIAPVLETAYTYTYRILKSFSLPIRIS